MRKKNFTWAFACIAVLAVAGSARAGPIPASPSPVPSLGESDLFSFVTPGSDVNVDWEVLPILGGFAYLYQLENTSTVPIDLFTVSFDTSGVIGAGVLFGDDLDLATLAHPAHVIVGEEEGFPTAPLPVATTVTPGDVTWTWPAAPLAPGTQSETLFFLDTRPPKYGVGVISDASPPSPWGSLAPGSDPVPVPTPEPSTLVLAGMALPFAIGAIRRRLAA